MSDNTHPIPEDLQKLLKQWSLVGWWDLVSARQLCERIAAAEGRVKELGVENTLIKEDKREAEFLYKDLARELDELKAERDALRDRIARLEAPVSDEECNDFFDKAALVGARRALDALLASRAGKDTCPINPPTGSEETKACK